jgi:hypothetical protein
LGGGAYNLGKVALLNLRGAGKLFSSLILALAASGIPRIMYLLAALLPILILFPTVIRASCYFPDGGQASLDVPCDASATESFCCFSAQACLSNKLCYDPTTLQYARGTCTDPNWESAACPKFCLDGTQQRVDRDLFPCFPFPCKANRQSKGPDALFPFK